MEKQETSNIYGISQELLVLSELCKYGVVSIPYGNSARYDCILDAGDKYYRIQIKSLNMIDSETISIPFTNSRMSASGIVRKQYTQNDIDFIAIYFNGNIYLFNPALSKSYYTVKTVKPQYHNQHYIEDYSIQKILGITVKSWTALKEESRKESGYYQDNAATTQKIQNKKYTCIDCGALVNRKNSRCLSCYRLIPKSSVKPDRETLKNEIKNYSFAELGRKYGVTDNAIRKWCKTYNLPHLKEDIKKIILEGKWEFV